MMETWADMTIRHKKERIELVESLAQSRFTQTESARILDTTLNNLNTFVKRNGINWLYKRQGSKTK
jgi:transcriptional regulator with GAF, ATPase, and Fis domain|tara:strand:+ start:231 stop:428 length:198 start_codon:yes stop_codon:yes gene_type:complete